MNANKQDAGGEVTNPDNVGGLLPCPFCGHDESLYIEHVEGTIRHPAYYVRCDYCGAQTGSTDSGEHVKKWNERAELCRAAPAGGDVEVVRLRQLLAASQEQVRILSDMVERGQAHHERMMKLMDSAPAGGDVLALIAQARREYRDSDAAGDVLDWLEEQASTPAGAGEVELGGWLWGKLMDFCKGRRFHPAEFNDLFAIVSELRALLRKLQHGAEYSPNSVAKRKRVEIEALGYVCNGVSFMHPKTGRRGLLDDFGAVHWIASQGQEGGTNG